VRPALSRPWVAHAHVEWLSLVIGL
jgi:hypothetical protein